VLRRDVPQNAIASCHCVQIERRWNKCAVSSGSTVADVTRRPNSVMNSRPVQLIGPNDSRAMGTKLRVAGRSAYFVTFRETASSVTLPGVVEIVRMHNAAYIY